MQRLSVAFYREFCAVCAIFYVCGLVIGIGGAFYGITQCLHIVGLAVRHVLEIVVKHGEPVGWQGIGKLEFCALHVLDCLERFKVLFAHGSYYADLRMYYAAYLFYVARLFRSHLHDEHVVVRLQLLAHSAHNSHRRVEASGSHQHVELLAEYAVEVMLRACLAIAACYAYYFHIGHLGEYAFCVVDIHFVDCRFDRVHHPVGEQQHHPRQHGQQQQCHRYRRIGVYCPAVCA